MINQVEILFLTVKPNQLATVRSVLEKYEKHRSSCLMITYETLGDYLWLLKGISNELNKIGSSAMMYLAAAVADFYIPKNEMVRFKSCDI